MGQTFIYISPDYKPLGGGTTRGAGGSYTGPGDTGFRVIIVWDNVGFTGKATIPNYPSGAPVCPYFDPYDTVAVENWVINTLPSEYKGGFFNALQAVGCARVG